jgi:YD repeat-containing protein
MGKGILSILSPVFFSLTMTVSAFVHASVNIALAPSPTPWSYALCDDGYASNTIRSIGKCIAFEEGKWNGNYSPCTDTSPISEGNAVDRAKNFTRYVHQACDDLNAQRQPWPGPGESIGGTWCQGSQPYYQNGIEIENSSRINVSGYKRKTDGSCDLSRPIQERIVLTRRRTLKDECPLGFQKVDNICTPSGMNPHKNNLVCPSNGSNPIHTRLGTKLQSETDYLGVGKHPLRFVRKYTSSELWEKTELGMHWRHTYSRSIYLVETASLSTATVIREDGNRYYFSLISGRWTPDEDVTDRLEELTDAQGQRSGWRYTRKDDAYEQYDSQGRLLSITYKDELTKTLSYDITSAEGGDDNPTTLDRISDPFGRTLSLAYDVYNRLSTLTDPAGNLYTYTYNSQGYLAEVIYPDDTPADSADNPTRQYLYEDARYPHALTGIIDENGARFATWNYDDQGRAYTSEHAGGSDRVTLTYNADGTTTVTDALGAARTYTFETLHGVIKPASITGDQCTQCAGSAQASSYDANGFLASKTDWNGNVTHYVHNSRGLQISRTEAAGTAQARTITTEWHPDYRLPTRIDEPGKRTELSYTANGLLHTRTERDTATNATRTWTYTYTAEGLLDTVDGPRTDVNDITDYDYDTQGNLVRVTKTRWGTLLRPRPTTPTAGP